MISPYFFFYKSADLVNNYQKCNKSSSFVAFLSHFSLKTQYLNTSVAFY